MINVLLGFGLISILSTLNFLVEITLNPLEELQEQAQDVPLASNRLAVAVTAVVTFAIVTTVAYYLGFIINLILG